MTDYNAYRDAVGISNPEMTRTIREKYPAFTRINSNFINHPASHGVCLLPEAELHLVSRYGAGPGLQFIVTEEDIPKKKRPDKRRKKNRITFRMDEEAFDRYNVLKDAYGIVSDQEFLERILRDAYARWEES